MSQRRFRRRKGSGLLSPAVMTKRQRRKLRAVISALLFVNVLLIGVWYWNAMDKKVPSHIYLFRNRGMQIDFSVPMVGSLREAQDVIAVQNSGGAGSGSGDFSLDRPLTVTASQIGSYRAEVKLFGLFHYKYIHFDVIDEAKVMPSGKAVGLYLQSDGIMVLGTSKIQGRDGFSYEPAKDILQPGDRIYQVEDKPVESIDEVIQVLQQSHKKKVKLQLVREKNKINVKLETVYTKDGEYKIGVWLREDTEGIGTLSFVTENNQFAALGHGIADVDTGKLIELQKGTVYPAQIQGIKKGKAGEPGELIGSVKLGTSNLLGVIKSNTELGITGDVAAQAYTYNESRALPVGLKQEVQEGKAWIYCQLGGAVEKFEVEIEEINRNSRDNKGMVLRITDKRLLKQTGGIVQGMSGAPIIQNGKVIGAVTHVFVNDPAGGYGTFMENML